MASTGSIYFIAKYKLARNGLAALESPPCSHQEAIYEALVSTPYRSVFATKAAKKDLKRLGKVLENEVKCVEELLDKRREDLGRKEREKEQNRTNGPNNDEQAVTPRLRINLRVNNSPSVTSGLSQPQLSNSGPRPKVILPAKNLKLTPPNVPQASPSTHIQSGPPSSATTEQQKSNKRKNEGLFNLEPPSKRPHLDYCRAIPEHVAAKPFRADDYDYKTPPSTFVPKSQRTIVPEIPAERATTRRMTAKGARLHTPEDDNFNPDGGLKRIIPACRPVSSAKKNEIRSDFEAMVARRKAEEIYRPLLNELKAFARRYDCEEAPDLVYWEEKARKEVKKKAGEVKRKAEEAKKILGDELAFRHQNRAHEQRFELLVADFKEKNEAVLEGAKINGMTQGLTPLIEATERAAKEVEDFKSRWDNWKKGARSKVDGFQEPAEKVFDAQLEFQRQNSIHEWHLNGLVADFTHKMKAPDYKKELNGVGRRFDSMVVETGASAKKVEKFKVWYQDWKTERLAQIAELQQNAKVDNRRTKEPNSHERDLKHDHCLKYRVAHKCAEFARENVEAKEKINNMAREIDTINQKLGPDVNGYQLSGIPVHIRMLDNDEKHHRVTWSSVNGAFRVHRQVPRSSPLRYELGSCLAEKARAVAAKAAKEAAEEGLRRQQAAELLARKRRIREELQEIRRLKKAKMQVREFVKHRAFPDLKDSKQKQCFKKAFGQWYQMQMKKREQGGESSEGLESDQGYESSQVEMDGMESELGQGDIWVRWKV
jgi:hypothetical protein